MRKILFFIWLPVVLWGGFNFWLPKYQAAAKSVRGLESLNETATQSGFATDDLNNQDANAYAQTSIMPVVQRIVTFLLEFLGVVFLVITIYGGVVWMTAGGSTEKVATAQKWIGNGLIGMAIVGSSWALAYLALWVLT